MTAPTPDPTTASVGEQIAAAIEQEAEDANWHEAFLCGLDHAARIARNFTPTVDGAAVDEAAVEPDLARLLVAISKGTGLNEAESKELLGSSLDKAATVPTSPTVVHVDRDSWPESISDGLTLPCTDCSTVPRFDYRVSEEFWAVWGDGPNVLCLPCLDARSGGVGLAEALIEIQWTGAGHTVCATPRARYEYPPATVPTSPTVTDGTADGLRKALMVLRDEFRAFDITDDSDLAKIPDWVDVPDDYEGGLAHAADRISSILGDH